MDIHLYVDGWRSRLEAWTIRSHGMAFEWGVHDCGLNASSAAEAQIGMDFAGRFRGRYASQEEGLALLAAEGFSDHADFAASMFPEIAPSFARIGDIAAVPFGAGPPTLMVVAGQSLIGPMPHMAGSVSRLKAVRAFAVGYLPDPEALVRP